MSACDIVYAVPSVALAVRAAMPSPAVSVSAYCPLVSVPSSTLFASIVVAKLAVALPKSVIVAVPVPVTSPVSVTVITGSTTFCKYDQSKSPSSVPATNVSEPTVHLSSVSFQINVLLAALPLSISIPEFCVGATLPARLLLSKIILSARLIVSVLTVVVVPLTVKSPPIVTLLLVSIVETLKAFVH